MKVQSDSALLSCWVDPHLTRHEMWNIFWWFKFSTTRKLFSSHVQKNFVSRKKNNFNLNQIIQNITNNMNRRNMNNQRNHQSGYFWTKTFAKTFISWKITIRKFLISRARDDITISAVMKKSLVYRCLTSDSFQTDALSLASDWLTFEKQRLHSHFEFY